MRTSEEIYHRVRWDPRFDPARFVLGVDLHGAEPKLVPLAGFVPGGDIPWHRVLFIEADGERVWDRATGADLLDTSAAGRVGARRLLSAPFFTARTPHVWHPVDGWVPAGAPTAIPRKAAGPTGADSNAPRRTAEPTGADSNTLRRTAEPTGADSNTLRRTAEPTGAHLAAAERTTGVGEVEPAVAGAGGKPAGGLRVITWNTLWDRYDADRIHTRRRRPLLVAALERAAADVIALQEVERDLLELLLRAGWVRDRYTLCTDPAGTDVDDSGVLLLSRVPVLESGRHVLGPYKQVTAITVPGPVVVAAVHLTSDHAADGRGRRAAELAELAGGLAWLDVPVVLAGDVNDGGDTPAQRLGLRDAWIEAHGPGDTTATFDPVRNPLAAVGSLTGRASRLDRVLLRGAGLTVVAAGLAGDVPHDGLFPSDHFAVVVDVTLGEPPAETIGARPTARTAVAWLPPQRLWPPVQDVRRALDPQVDRWPPHVNVLFGFLPEADFEDAAALLAAAAGEVSPFPAELSGVRTFAHRDDATVWLDPAAASPEPWLGLHRALRRRFPQCRGRAEGWTPHLTLGRAAGPVTVRLAPATAPVDRLTLLSRRGDEPMVPRAELLLGTGELRWLPDPPPPAPPAADPAGVLATLRAALPEAIVHLAGSRRLGCDLPGADLDLVAVFPGAPGHGLAGKPGAALPREAHADVPGVVDVDGLRRRVAEAAGPEWSVRTVTGARVPGLRLNGTGNRAGLAVDLVTVGAGGLPVAEAVARRAELDEPSAVALSAVSDAEAVLAATATAPGFTGLARSVKAWARARGLDSAPFGGLPGLAWVVLAARTARDAGDRDPDELLRDFHGAWAAWDWTEPVALTGAATVVTEAYPMMVLTPSAPVRICTGQVSAGVSDLVVEELYRSWDGQPATPPHRRHRAWAVLTVEPVAGEAFEETIGRFRGRVRALLTALEEAGVTDAHAWPRPFTSGPAIREYAVGLGRRPPDAATLAAVVAPWLATLPGVRADRADGGAVPTLR
ncbi:poly(A) polymerase [Actinoplanes philippinensis]|uniref:poly(A) polymerase n=2 Tax=Actinoplanes philippinensis TaxID=35752 RepID=UPI001C42E50D|nr:poly(A) polymerase [Actinoplanes philippinensis]